jgi:catechol 2,3-dioxygenase-like lactoylglutathione lyase family enzyme
MASGASGAWEEPLGELFHVCLVTADLGGTMEALTRTTGTAWTSPVTSEMPVRLAEGADVVLTPTVVYSTTFPYVELHEARPGTALAMPPEGGVHHVGYWVEDLPGRLAALAARGFRQEVVGRAADGGPSVFAYLLAPAGHRVELVDSVVRARIETWIAGGSPV